MNMDLPPKDTHIEHSKVNSILYTCPFGRFVDGILLDPHSHACSGWRATRAPWRRLGARERLHRPRGKLGRKDRNEKKQLQTSDVRRLSDVRRVGRPTTFRRPTCRTSDSQRTSEIMIERLQMHRTSGRLRTSDVSDVRNPTDVRHPSTSSAKTPAARRQRSDFRT